MSPGGRKLLRTTPMRDLVRGRITGRLDREAPTSDLPDTVRELVRTIVKRTRLWRLEKADVARELAAHFHDGLDAGTDADALVSSFGDPKSAAKLIRRAKKRRRPIAWHAMRYTRNGFGVVVALFVLLYGPLWVRYYAVEPTLSRNVAAEHNAKIAAIPEADRAWPRYLAAAHAIASVPISKELRESRFEKLTPDDELWAESIEFLDKIEPQLAELRDAAAMLNLGYLLTDTISPEIDEIRCLRSGRDLSSLPDRPEPSENPSAITILLPNVGELRYYAQLFVLEALRAMLDGDADRFVANVRGIIGTAEHAREQPFLICDIVAARNFAWALTRIDDALANHTDLLGDEHLHELAHAVAGFADGRLTPRYDGERAMLLDFVQRVYTDDGNGDGRFVGFEYIEQYSLGFSSTETGWPTETHAFIAPIVSLNVASRKDATDLIKRLASNAEAMMAAEPWERQRGRYFGAREINLKDLIERRGLGVLEHMVPTYLKPMTTADRLHQRRWATLTVIALELHHRRHGGYPESLDELVPEFLPSLPRDMFTGDVLGYHVTDDGPVLYSVGVDRKDDGGRPPQDADDPNNSDAAKWAWPDNLDAIRSDPLKYKRIDGDWILYPPVESKEDD